MLLKGSGFMANINGTFICLHSCNKTISPYYNTAEFADRLCLADCFTGGNPPYGDSYIASDRNEILQRIAGAGVLGKLFLVESNSAHNITYFLATSFCAAIGAQTSAGNCTATILLSDAYPKRTLF